MAEQFTLSSNIPFHRTSSGIETGVALGDGTRDTDDAAERAGGFISKKTREASSSETALYSGCLLHCQPDEGLQRHQPSDLRAALLQLS